LFFIDEADEFQERCPALAAVCRELHNNGHARFVLVGYRRLRKLVNNAQRFGLINDLEPLTLSGFSLRECGALVTGPMEDLGIQLVEPTRIVTTIFHHSGGAPNRIQLFCHALVEAVDRKNQRVLEPKDAEEVVRLPSVRDALIGWFHDSTDALEKHVAIVASLNPALSEDELIERVRDTVPLLTTADIRTAINGLVVANILDCQSGSGRLDFTFPSAREIARPVGSPKQVKMELRHSARRAWEEHRK
jgi:hypothetical protein